MCDQPATLAAIAHLEHLLKQHEDASEARGNEVASMLAMLPDPPLRWIGTVRIPWLGVVQVTLRATTGGE